MLCDDLWGRGCGEGREASEGGDIYIIIADSSCMAETNRHHCKAIFLQLKIMSMEFVTKKNKKAMMGASMVAQW